MLTSHFDMLQSQAEEKHTRLEPAPHLQQGGVLLESGLAEVIIKSPEAEDLDNTVTAWDDFVTQEDAAFLKHVSTMTSPVRKLCEHELEKECTLEEKSEQDFASYVVNDEVAPTWESAQSRLFQQQDVLQRSLCKQTEMLESLQGQQQEHLKQIRKLQAMSIRQSVIEVHHAQRKELLKEFRLLERRQMHQQEQLRNLKEGQAELRFWRQHCCDPQLEKAADNEIQSERMPVTCATVVDIDNLCCNRMQTSVPGNSQQDIAIAANQLTSPFLHKQLKKHSVQTGREMTSDTIVDVDGTEIVRSMQAITGNYTSLDPVPRVRPTCSAERRIANAERQMASAERRILSCLDAPDDESQSLIVEDVKSMAAFRKCMYRSQSYPDIPTDRKQCSTRAITVIQDKVVSHGGGDLFQVRLAPLSQL
jgi:hypothetical protein